MTGGRRPGGKNPARTASRRARSAARLAAVQALYQAELGGEDADTVINEFVDHRLGKEIEGDRYLDADEVFFRDLVAGAERRQGEIDTLISAALSSDWSLERLERIMRALLRAGAYELVARPDVPTKVVINEYVDVAHAFFGNKEPGFVNGVLDRLGRSARDGGQPPGGAEANA
jgi:N utilization substance protein B